MFILYVILHMRVCGSRLVLLMVWLLWDLGTGTPNHTRTHSSTPPPPHHRSTAPRTTQSADRSGCSGHCRTAELYAYVSLFSSTPESAPVLLLSSRTTTTTATATTATTASRTAHAHAVDPQAVGQLAKLHDTSGAVGQNAALCAR